MIKSDSAMNKKEQTVELPHDIIYKILSRLPVKPLCHFKSVSKSWRSLISNPQFVAYYSKLAIENKDVFFTRRRPLFSCAFFEKYPHPGHLYSLDLDHLLNENQNVDVGGELVAPATELDYVYNHIPRGERKWNPIVHRSRYGLFLTDAGLHRDRRCLINPVTKKSKTLPVAPIWRLPMYSDWKHMYGLGLDYSTNECKVVNGQHCPDGVLFNVYTLQTDSWRQIDCTFPYRLYRSEIVVNGAVHWLAMKVADCSLVIISFLLAEEEVKEIALPPKADASFTHSSSSLSYKGTYNELWVMKEYGVRESWTKMRFSKPYRDLSHSGFWRGSYDLMVFDKSSLVMYNFSEEKFWTLLVQNSIGEEGWLLSVGICVESPSPLINQEQRTRTKKTSQLNKLLYSFTIVTYCVYYVNSILLV